MWLSDAREEIASKNTCTMFYIQRKENKNWMNRKRNTSNSLVTMGQSIRKKNIRWRLSNRAMLNLNLSGRILTYFVMNDHFCYFTSPFGVVQYMKIVNGNLQNGGRKHLATDDSAGADAKLTGALKNGNPGLGNNESPNLWARGLSSWMTPNKGIIPYNTVILKYVRWDVFFVGLLRWHRQPSDTKVYNGCH